MKIEFIIVGKTNKDEIKKLATEAGFVDVDIIDDHLFSAECKNKKIFETFDELQDKLEKLFKQNKKKVSIVRKAYNIAEIIWKLD